ncbi:hypothetical protein KBB96_13430 [Luteolibacter ambystomatis]|uniref:Uncharacterized protein n=1 Tax=Luteolibacter ambystomatis TaxID=2824561 RepID=A0A975G7S9_9BACT|nr:hypothetical protein [Luteolibacter ambystomatis]QUE49870.1 hypothetical protein KBB96_13430 [Luteolibacter ambystomatis]
MPLPEPESQNLLTVAIVVAGLLLFCLFVLLRISWRLARIEKGLGGQPEASRRSEKSEKSDSGETPDMSGPFGKFLSERPELIQASKSEQFAAYRKWRKDQGLNWEGR